MSSTESIKNDHFKSEATHKPANSISKNLWYLLAIFLLSFLVLYVAYQNFPKVSPEEAKFLKFPRDIEDAKNLGKVLSSYKESYFWHVLFGYMLAYIFLQTFAIPGSIFLSILSGFLFPFSLAIFLVCLCSAVGASCCYLISYLVGRQLVFKYFPQKAQKWGEQVDKHRSNLLSYIIFLRITPFLPNWFINLASPVINVPLYHFFLGTFIGVCPPSFVAIQAGTTLQQLTSSADAFSMSSILITVTFATISLLPVLFKSKLQSKLE